jgi:hypothetical protein
MDKSWSGHSTFRPLRNAEGDDDAEDSEEGDDDMEKKALDDVWFPERTEFEQVWFGKTAEEDPEKVSGAPSAEGLFFKNPMTFETRQFAESKANTNHADVAVEHAKQVNEGWNHEEVSKQQEVAKQKKAPPTPTDVVKDEAGGEEFSTLNRLVVKTDQKTEKAMPEDWHDTPKMDEVEVAPVKEAARYRNDPRWIKAKYPGIDMDGKPFKRGEMVFYYPKTKDFLTGAAAEKASRGFDSAAEDEDFYMGLYASKKEASSESLLDVWGIIGEDK